MHSRSRLTIPGWRKLGVDKSNVQNNGTCSFSAAADTQSDVIVVSVLSSGIFNLYVYY
jgi:hypothetical protein